MGTGQRKAREDEEDYIDLCERFGEVVQTKTTVVGGGWGRRVTFVDCYGSHASELSRRANAAISDRNLRGDT